MNDASCEDEKENESDEYLANDGGLSHEFEECEEDATNSRKGDEKAEAAFWKPTSHSGQELWNTRLAQLVASS